MVQLFLVTGTTLKQKSSQIVKYMQIKTVANSSTNITTYFSGEDGGVMATVASAESLPDEDDMPE